MLLTKTIRWTLDFLNLRYDADISAIPSPDIPRTRTAKRTNQIKEPDNIVRDKADNTPRTFTDIDNGREWEKWDRQRTSQITDMDRQVCEQRSLDLTKYGIVKVAWATKINGNHMSASQASKRLSSEIGKGYGKRTIESYYSAINEANPSPASIAA